jgi:hypothetical protein
MQVQPIPRADGRLDAWVRALTLSALLLLSLTLVATTLLLRPRNRTGEPRPSSHEELALFEGEMP